MVKSLIGQGELKSQVQQRSEPLNKKGFLQTFKMINSEIRGKTHKKCTSVDVNMDKNTLKNCIKRHVNINSCKLT